MQYSGVSEMRNLLTGLSLLLVVACDTRIDAIGGHKKAYVHVTDICQQATKVVKCGTGSVIYVEHGWYGRTDHETCVIVGVPTMCHPEKSSYQKIWEKCEGKNECRLTASDSFMGDKKCLSTERYQKYIRLEYRCQKPGETIIGTCHDPLVWGPWLDTDDPTGIGDLELLSHHEKRVESCRTPKAIEVRLVNGSDLHSSNNVVRVSLGYGVQCLGHLQEDGVCEDFKIRYCCPQRSDIRCTHPGHIMSGVAKPRFQRYFLPGETVTYSCKRDHALVGANELMCQLDKTWSDEVPSCVEPGPEICVDPKVYRPCSSRCPPTCGAPEPICSKRCNRFSFCQCPLGLLQRGEKDTSCVLPSECEGGLACPGNKIYSPCVSKCQATCEEPAPTCDHDCDRTKFCACQTGTVLKTASSDECIEQDRCPTPN